MTDKHTFKKLKQHDSTYSMTMERQSTSTPSRSRNLWDNTPNEVKRMIFRHADILTQYLNGEVPLIYEHSAQLISTTSTSTSPRPTSPISTIPTTIATTSSSDTHLKVYPQTPPHSQPLTPQSQSRQHHHLHQIQNLRQPRQITQRDLWTTAFKINWTPSPPSILHHLPIDELPGALKGLCNLHSRSLYLQLCQYRQDLCNLDPWKLLYVNQKRFGNVKCRDDVDARYTQYVRLRCDDPGELDPEVVDVKGINGMEGLTPQQIQYQHQRRIKSQAYYDEVNPYQFLPDFHFDVGVLDHSLLQVPLRQMWLDLIPTFFFDRPILLAAISIYYGHANLLRHLITNYNVNPTKFEGMKQQYTIGVIALAAERGHLDVVKVLHTYGCDTNKSAMNMAACYGHLDVVKWLYENQDEGCSECGLGATVAGGHYEIVKWLIEHKSGQCFNADIPLSEYYPEVVREGGIGLLDGIGDGDEAGIYGGFGRDEVMDRMNVLKFLCEELGLRVSEKALVNLAARGEVEMVGYLIERVRKEMSMYCDGRCGDGSCGRFGNVTTTSMESKRLSLGVLDAVRIGAVEFVKQHLDENGFLASIRNGCMASFRNLYTHFPDIPLDVIATNAAKAGQLDILKWLHAMTTQNIDNPRNDSTAMEITRTSKGFSKRAMDVAAKNGHLDVVKFLHLNRPEGCTTDAMDSAATNGHLEIVKYLHYNRSEGCTTRAMDGAAGNGMFHAVSWLHQNRKEGCTTEAMDSAAEAGMYRIVHFLCVNRWEGCSIHGVRIAVQYGFLKVAREMVE
ncbi:hypothetical protein HDU76_007706, partial [Blyttiomyces sp. JEL0837]